MAKAVIIVKSKGQLIPTPFLEKAIAAYTGTLGIAFAEKGAINVNRLTDFDGFDLELLSETQEALKDKDVVLYFGPKVEHVDDHQPFVIIEDDKLAKAIAFIHGDCDGYAVENSAHPAEFFMANMFLKPKLGREFVRAKRNLAEVTSELKNHVTQNDLKSGFVKEGAVTFLLANGDVIAVDKHTPASTFPWGWVSDSLGYTETPAVTDKPGTPISQNSAGQKLRDMLKLKKASAEQPATVVDKPPQGDTAIPKEVPSPEKPKDVATELPSQQIRITVPKNLTTKNDRSAWWNREWGFVPQGYKNLQFLDIMSNDPRLKKDKPSVIKTLSELGEHVKPVEKPVEKPAEQPSVKPDADKQKEDFDADSIIPAEEKKFISELFLSDDSIIKAIDNHSHVLSDPKKLQEIEKKYPSFDEQFGGKLTLNDVKKWPPSVRKEFCEQFPIAAGVLIRDLIVANEKQASKPAEEAPLAPSKEQPAKPLSMKEKLAAARAKQAAAA